MKPVYTDYLPTLEYWTESTTYSYNRGLGTFGKSTENCLNCTGLITLTYDDNSTDEVTVTKSGSYSFAKLTGLNKYPISLMLTIKTSSDNSIEFYLSSLKEGNYTLQWAFSACDAFADLILIDDDEVSGEVTWKDLHSAIAVGQDISTTGTLEVVKYNSTTGKAYYKVTGTQGTSEIDLLSDGVSQQYINDQAVRYTDLLLN